MYNVSSFCQIFLFCDKSEYFSNRCFCKPQNGKLVDFDTNVKISLPICSRKAMNDTFLNNCFTATIVNYFAKIRGKLKNIINI